MESKLIIRIFLWVLNFFKAVFYAPVVISFAGILFIFLAGLQDTGSSHISISIIHFIFPREGSYDGGDIMAKYGWYALIASLVVGLIGLLTGKKFELRRKTTFWILAITAVLGWACATIIMYTQSGHDASFLWIGPGMFLGHLLFIAIAVGFSYVVEVIERLFDKAALRDTEL